MFKVTMVSAKAEASFMVRDVKEAWQAIAPAISIGTPCNVHVEDVETGEVVFLFQDGEIKHMEESAVLGFLDMVYEVNPLLAIVMALDLHLLATMEQALGE